MNALDYVIIAVLLTGFVIGFIKGVIKQAFSLGGLILGIVCGTLLYKPFAGLLQNIFSFQDKTAQIVAFIVILLLVPILCGFVGKLISKLVHAVSLGFLDRLLGALFGLFKYLLIIGLIIKFLDMTDLSQKIVNNHEKSGSKLYTYVSDVTGFCLQWTWNKVQGTARDLMPELPERDSKNKEDNGSKV